MALLVDRVDVQLERVRFVVAGRGELLPELVERCDAEDGLLRVGKVDAAVCEWELCAQFSGNFLEE